MKQERVIYTKEFFATQMNHWILYTVALTIMGLLGASRPGIIPWAPLSLLPFCQFLVRRNVKDRVMFVLGNIGVTALFAALGYVLIADKTGQVLYILFAVGYFAYSCIMRFALHDRMSAVLSPVVAVLITGAGLFIQRTWGYPGIDNTYIIFAAVIIGLHFLNMFVGNYIKFLEANKSSAGRIPAREIFRSGMGITALFTVGGIVILVLSASIEWLGSILNTVSGWILALLRMLGIKFKETQGDEPPPGLPDLDDLLGVDNENATTSGFARVMQVVLIVVGVVAAIALVIFAIYKIIKFIKGYHKEKGTKTSEELNSMDDVREKVAVEKQSKKSGSLFGFLSYRERIRKQYKKRVLSEKDKIVGKGDKGMLSYRTAYECGTIMEDADLVLAYEKARYTEDSCTAGDLKLAKG